MRRYSFAALLILSLGACASPRDPSDVYEEYNQRVIAGMSFEEEMDYFTSRKRQEVEQQLPEMMSRTGRTRAEVIDVYQDFSRQMAKCTEITLAEERIEEATAYLVYDQRDTCGSESGTNEAGGKQSVRLVDEDGWKIDEVEISL